MNTDNDQKEVWRMSQTGHEKLVAWHLSKRAVDDLEERLRTAKGNLIQSAKSLGDWLCPLDAKSGEIFNVSVGDGFLQVRLDGQEPYASYTISWRVEPCAKTLGSLH